VTGELFYDLGSKNEHYSADDVLTQIFRDAMMKKTAWAPFLFLEGCADKRYKSASTRVKIIV